MIPTNVNKTDDQGMSSLRRRWASLAAVIAVTILAMAATADYYEVRRQKEQLFDLVFSRTSQTSFAWTKSGDESVEYGNGGTDDCPKRSNAAHSRLQEEIVLAMPTWTPGLDRVCVRSILLPGPPARTLRVSVQARYHGLLPLPDGFPVSVTVDAPA